MARERDLENSAPLLYVHSGAPWGVSGELLHAGPTPFLACFTFPFSPPGAFPYCNVHGEPGLQVSSIHSTLHTGHRLCAKHHGGSWGRAVREVDTAHLAGPSVRLWVGCEGGNETRT